MSFAEKIGIMIMGVLLVGLYLPYVIVMLVLGFPAYVVFRLTKSGVNIEKPGAYPFESASYYTRNECCSLHLKKSFKNQEELETFIQELPTERDFQFLGHIRSHFLIYETHYRWCASSKLLEYRGSRHYQCEQCDHYWELSSLPGSDIAQFLPINKEAPSDFLGMINRSSEELSKTIQFPITLWAWSNFFPRFIKWQLNKVGVMKMRFPQPGPAFWQIVKKGAEEEVAHSGCCGGIRRTLHSRNDLKQAIDILNFGEKFDFLSRVRGSFAMQERTYNQPLNWQSIPDLPAVLGFELYKCKECEKLWQFHGAGIPFGLPGEIAELVFEDEKSLELLERRFFH